MLKSLAVVLLGLALPAAATAQVMSGDPDLPIAFTTAVPDICFPVINGHALNQGSAAAFHLDHIGARPEAVRDRYPNVPDWYRSQSKPKNIFVGMGDGPNRCHIVLADTKDARQAYRNLATLLTATGFSALEDPNGLAITLYVKHSANGNTLVLLKGLTNAIDGAGPQVSVDVSAASDDMLKTLLGSH